MNSAAFSGFERPEIRALKRAKKPQPTATLCQACLRSSSGHSLRERRACAVELAKMAELAEGADE